LFLVSYWTAGIATFLQAGLRFPLAGGFCKFYANERRKLPLQRRPLEVRHALAVSQSDFIII
jgi:hypothetical protein